MKKFIEFISCELSEPTKFGYPAQVLIATESISAIEVIHESITAIHTKCGRTFKVSDLMEDIVDQMRK